ncbi:hypothetical protein BS78_06G094200 [Paspalum vaginatum]|nr:hypothetical protein BS78_06G094200 [Paspalum vaginatum]
MIQPIFGHKREALCLMTCWELWKRRNCVVLDWNLLQESRAKQPYGVIASSSRTGGWSRNGVTC